MYSQTSEMQRVSLQAVYNLSLCYLGGETDDHFRNPNDNKYRGDLVGRLRGKGRACAILSHESANSIVLMSL